MKKLFSLLILIFALNSYSQKIKPNQTFTSVIYAENLPPASPTDSLVTVNSVGLLQMLPKSSVSKGTVSFVQGITELEAYAGDLETLIVKDSLRGGIFNYVATGVVDNGTVFPATGKGSGYWQRQYDESTYVNVQWYGAVSDYDIDLATGTDNTPIIQALLDSFDKKSVSIFFPRTREIGKFYGFSNTIFLGQNTKIIGDNHGFPIQYNPSDTLTYNVPTVLYFYNDTNGLESQSTENYRSQLPTIESICIMGTGKANGASGLKFSSNPNYIHENPNAQDVGLVTINNVYIDGFQNGIDAVKADTFYMSQSHISRCSKGLINGKHDLFISTNCFFDIDEVAIETGSRNSHITNNEIEPGLLATGVRLIDGAFWCNVSENTIKISHIPIELNEAGSANQIKNNIILNTHETSIKIINSGGDNIITGNNIANFTLNAIDAINTNRLFVSDNVIRATSSLLRPYKIINCNDTYVDLPFNNTYLDRVYLDVTGSNADKIRTSMDRFYSSETFNPSPLMKFFKSNGGLATQSPLLNNNVLGGMSGLGWGSTFYADRVGLEMRANEDWTGSANGGKIVMSMANNGATAKTDRHNFTYNGYTSSGNINILGAGLNNFRTTDITTNTEKGMFGYNGSNELEIGHKFEGIGTSSRKVKIGTGASAGLFNRTIDIQSSAPFFSYQFGTTGVAGYGSDFFGGNTFNSSSNAQGAISILPTINQSGTASFKTFYVSPYFQSVGSGSKFILDIGKNSAANNAGTHTSYFNMDDNGLGNFANVLTFQASPIVPTPITDFQASTKKYVDETSSLTENITSQVTLGGIGSGAVLFTGMTLTQFVKLLLTPTQFPTYTGLTQTLTNDKGLLSTNYEVGTTFTDVTFSKTYTQGLIRGKLVGGVWEPLTEQGKRTGVLINFNINGTDIGTASSLNVGDIKVVYGANTITSLVSYGAGDQPIDSSGNNYQTALAPANAGQNLNFSGFFRMFWGSDLTNTVSDVRALSSSALVTTTLKSVTLTTGTANQYFHVFLPSSFLITNVLDTSDSNNDITSDYQMMGTVDIPDAGGDLRTYIHYMMDNEIPYVSSHTHNIYFN